MCKVSWSEPKWPVFAKPIEKWIGNLQKRSVFVQGDKERDFWGVFSYEKNARIAGEQSDHFSREEENAVPSKPALFFMNLLRSRKFSAKRMQTFLLGLKERAIWRENDAKVSIGP